MTRRQLAYLALVQALTFIALALGGYGYINHVDSERREGERRAAAARAVQAEQTRRLVCELSLRNAEVYAGATTQVGRDARDVWLQFAARFNCDPPPPR